MKKLVSVLLALALTFTLTAAFAKTYTAGTYYTVEYPDSMSLDDTSYVQDNTEDDAWLFMLSGDDYLIDASLSTVDEYSGFSLYSATDAEKQAYVAEVMTTFADQDPALVDTVIPASGIPFYIFSMEDSDGVYYFAETIANGVSLYFCCYYNDVNAPLDQPLLDSLKGILKTFAPVNDGAAAA